MNRIVIVNLLLLAGFAGQAQAACPASGTATAMSQAQIDSFFPGKRIHATGSGDDWKEDHCTGSGGNLYKVGDGSAVDPRKVVGTWTTGGGADGTIAYAYTGASTYTWHILADNPASPTQVFFCDGSTEIAHSVSIGSAGPCP